MTSLRPGEKPAHEGYWACLVQSVLKLVNLRISVPISFFFKSKEIWVGESHDAPPLHVLLDSTVLYLTPL